MRIYQKILVAIDISDEAKQVLRKAAVLADQNKASIDIIHVVEPVVIETTFDVTPVVDVEVEQNLVKRSQNFINNLINEIGMTIDEILVPVGSPKAEIHQAVKDKGSDLIVIGTHGRHGVGLLLGSTANSVLHGAECDVLSVRISKD